MNPVPPQACAMPAKSIGCKSTPYSGFPRNTICSHLICPSVPFFTMTTLMGELIFHCGRKISHQHRETAVSHESDALSLGMRYLRGDRIRKPVGHAGEIAGETYESALSSPECVVPTTWRLFHCRS